MLKSIADIYPNPFMMTTTEYKIYRNLIKAVDFYNANVYGAIDERLIFNNWKLPRRSAPKPFVKYVINKFDVEFSISDYEYTIFKNLPSLKGSDKYERFNKFFTESIPILTKFHKGYLNNLYNYDHIDRTTNKEEIKRILLGVASIERRSQLNLKELMIEINDKLLSERITMTNKEMHEFYISCLPKKVIKTKTTIKKTINSFSNKSAFIGNPWTSSNKANDFMERNKWSIEDRENWKSKQLADSFDFKKQSKSYMLRTVAPRHSFIIDYFFPGKFSYLLAVNINTRKSYAIPSPGIVQTGENRFTKTETNNKTTDTAISQLNKLIKQTKIKFILCDQEAAFKSDAFHRLCTNNGIKIIHYIKNNVKGLIETNEASRGNHGALSILDRLCRTIRRMNYNLGNSSDIPPDIMERLIQEYNNSPHKTLSDIVGFPISPNEVDANKRIEDEIVFNRIRDNLKIKLKNDYNIIGQNCRCLNESSKFDKVKNKLLPGIWKIVGTEHGLFICKQGKYTIKLPRWMIKVI